MRGIRLDFTSAKGAVFNFTKPVEGFDNTVQNILVELGQKTNTDAIYSEKGNDLHKDSTSGGFVDPESFAIGLADLASTIQNFIKDTEDPNNTITLQNLELDLEVWDSDAARLKVIATGSDGNTVGTASTNL